jgi:hypothetical protein
LYNSHIYKNIAILIVLLAFNLLLLKLKIALFLFLFYGNFVAVAQQNPKVRDSAKMYRSIEKYAKKSKFRKFVYALVFEPIVKPNVQQNTFQNKLKTKNYAKVEGKIIRNIDITTLEPFGYSDIDTTAKPSTFFDKSGNILHLKTKNLAIKNLLLFKKNEPLDSLLVKESERLIRSQRFVGGVTVQTYLVAQDSVDVAIRVLDSWSLIPDFSTSTTKSNFYLTEKNFLGLGHEFSNSYQKSLTNKDFGYSTTYTIPNIKNTYIKTIFSYNIDLDGNYSKFINAERPFYSAYTRWAGGVIFGQNLNKTFTIDANQMTQIDNYKSNFQDYWAGHSFQIFKGNSEYNRSTNFITSARYYIRNNIEKPLFPTDSLGIYATEKLYLIGVGVSSRKFTQDKYIFNFNVVEDVGSGFVYNITSGYQFKNNQYKYYFGARIASGKYFDFGYLSGNLEYGTFFDNSKTVQSTISLKAVYFTNLFEFGKWKMRQFVKPQLIIGNNRLDSNSDKLTLNGITGIQGFSSGTLFGTKKFVATFQTQTYSPWKLLGFRMNPYLSYTMGMLGQTNDDFKYSKVYSQISLGFILSNDYLIFSNFQFSFSFYPTIPGDGNSIFKTNSISTYDFGLQRFEISKPVLVDYQ